MKKILLIIIIGILLLGVVAGVISFGMDEKEFTTKVNEISAKGLCDKLENKNEYQICENKNYEVSLSNNIISQNSKGVYMIGN